MTKRNKELEWGNGQQVHWLQDSIKFLIFYWSVIFNTSIVSSNKKDTCRPLSLAVKSEAYTPVTKYATESISFYNTVSFHIGKKINDTQKGHVSWHQHLYFVISWSTKRHNIVVSVEFGLYHQSLGILLLTIRSELRRVRAWKDGVLLFVSSSSTTMFIRIQWPAQ